MNYSLSACLVAFTLTASATALAQTQNPPLRQGVSVQMAKTANATAMPEADEEDAWVVAITADGRLFFGSKPVTPESLTEEMIKTPRRRDQNLYIKADARATFGNVQNALKSAKVDRFEAPVLLTNQNETPSLGKLVAPKGLEVLLTSALSEVVAVEVHNSAQPRPAVTVNDQEVALPDLQTALNQALQGKNNRVLQVQADNTLPFAQVAQVIDVCSSVKAKVVLPPTE
jgi:biopolymer transport protein TolR